VNKLTFNNKNLVMLFSFFFEFRFFLFISLLLLPPPHALYGALQIQASVGYDAPTTASTLI
jgi:hypothetical protein